MKKYYFLTCILLCAFLFNADARKITVTAAGLTFSPSNFTANVGDTVHFLWGSGTHTTTSTSIPLGAATWNASLNTSNRSFDYVIRLSGTYKYQCNFHVSMGMIGSFTVPAVTPKRITVTASGITFSPSSFAANVNDTVHFVWGSGTHTTTSTSVPTGAATWNAPLNSTNKTFDYIIKIGGAYNYQCNFHVSMGMKGSFTVPPITKTIVVKSGAVNICSNSDSIVFKCTQSKPPFKVQLFRYGVATGSVITRNDTMPFTIRGLSLGSYFVTAIGNNGTDANAGKSPIVALAPIPQGVLSTHIGTTTATIKWTHLSCVKFFTVRFRKQGTITFTNKNTSGNKDSLNLTGLTANTTFEYQVASNDSANHITATSSFSSIKTFKTAAAAAVITTNNSSVPGSVGKDKDLLIYPNPTSNSFTIQTNGLRFNSAQLRNEEGVVIWRAPSSALTNNNKLNVNVANVPAGTYFLQLVDINNRQHTEKIVIER
jgi:plastocyanin